MKKLLFLLVTFCALQIAQAQTTTIYIVRHGEKDLSNPSERDPELSAEGGQRALDLQKVLKAEDIRAVYSTNYKRTKNTVMPVAQQKKLGINTYDPGKPKDLVQKIKTEHSGETIVISGHSNTILEMAEAFGVEKPLKPLTDDDYDNLIKVVIKDGAATVSVSKYGVKHNSGN